MKKVLWMPTITDIVMESWGLRISNHSVELGRFEAMGGFGLGSAEAVNEYDFLGPQEVNVTGDYNKLFIQSNIGLETKPLEAGLALRLSQVTFSKFETSEGT